MATPEEVPLIGEVRNALDGGHPLDFLGLLSMVVLGTTAQPLQNPEEQPPSIGELVAAFIDVQVPETTALLAGLGEMLVDDDALRAQCRQAARQRRDGLPLWLAELGQSTVHRAVRMTHVLGDGDELLLGVRFADGQEMTGVVSIDHRSVVTDAFLVPESIDAVLAVAKSNNTDPDVAFADIDRADARASLQEALDKPLSMFPLPDSDTWPGCRALVQWLARLMPSGGGAHS
ncbi:hypothetical protein [Mycolicibacterium baixiangningiae]|uniref:hypothetical protein n=1 Tax=Mycolicibacterium baixiangningiae TaxID=2761578 RepID=UPI0018D12715|nr:hypothetical protein [Mycolicibacterium baixiangningiae]